MESLKRFEEAFEHAAVGMALVDLDGRILQVNRSVCDLLGYTRGELIGKTIEDVTHPDDLDADIEQLNRLFEAEINAYQLEKRYIHGNGHTVWGILSRSLVRDEYGVPLYYISQIQDISGRKALEEQLRRHAYHDFLTGLYNRVAFKEQLERALSLAERNSSSLAILFLDLDDFKEVNDSLGHDAGDRLLVEVANRLPACVRTEDTIARLGGDEFCVLLENLTDAGGALRTAERIKARLAEPFVLGAHRVPRLTASVGGVVTNPNGPPSAERLLNEADAAMYRVKKAGKAHHCMYLDLAG